MGREDGSLTRGGGTGAGDRARILDACRRESQADLLTGKVAGRARGGAATRGLAGAAGRAARGSRTAGDVGGGRVEFDRILGPPVRAALVLGEGVPPGRGGGVTSATCWRRSGQARSPRASEPRSRRQPGRAVHARGALLIGAGPQQEAPSPRPKDVARAADWTWDPRQGRPAPRLAVAP